MEVNRATAEVDEVVRKIREQRRIIGMNFQSGDALTDAANKLTNLNSYLSDNISEYSMEYADEKTRRHLQYTSEGDLSDSAAEKRIKAELAREKQTLINLNRFYKNVEAQVSTIQTRVKWLIEEERRNG